MPDPDRKTISATQVPALFDQSPFLTRWMLYHWLRGVDAEKKSDARMDAGMAMQPMLLKRAAEDLGFQVRANHRYLRRAPVGCTRDAIIYCPDRGPGALECKAVFDYRQWMARWEGGKRPPIDYEVQLQTQMMIGSNRKPHRWGVLAAWIAGEMAYFERQPDDALWEEIRGKSKAMLSAAAAGDEPDPFGAPVENPLIAKLYRVTAPATFQRIPDIEAGEKARLYAWAKREAQHYTAVEQQLRPYLAGIAGEVATTELPGALLRCKKDVVPASVVTLSNEHRLKLYAAVQVLDQFEGFDQVVQLLREMIQWTKTVRRDSVRTTIEVEVRDEVDQDLGSEGGEQADTVLAAG